MVNPVICRVTPYRWYLVTSDLYKDSSPQYIDWLTFLPPNIGTKNQRAYLVKSAKQLIAALLEAPRFVRGDRIAHVTVKNWVSNLRRLVKWMIERGIWRFSSLSSENVIQFLEGIRVKNNGAENVSHFGYFSFASLLKRMWEIRANYIAPLHVNIDTLGPSVRLTRNLKKREPWPALDESVAMPLIRDAIQWLSTQGDYVADLRERLCYQRRKYIAITRHKRSSEIAVQYRLIEKEPSFLALRNALKSEKPVARVIREAVRMTEGACIVLVLFLIGMRAREFTRLDKNCLQASTDEAGNSLHHLHGVAAKQAAQRRTWIASGPVLGAISFLEKAYRLQREESGKSALFLNRGDLFSPRRVGRASPESVTKRLVNFAHASFRDGSPKIGRIHPHVARKTFARFVVLRDKSALESLAYHYGHVHRSITDGYYVGSDFELARLISDESRKDLARGLSDLLSAPRVAGKAKEAMAAIKREMRPGSRFAGRKSLDSIVDKLIKDGVQLAPCDWGYCIYSQPLSACKGDERGPSQVNRSPEICASCANFAVTDRQMPWWEARLQREIEFLTREGLAVQTKQIVQARVSTSERILRDLVMRRSSLRHSADDKK